MIIKLKQCEIEINNEDVDLFSTYNWRIHGNYIVRSNYKETGKYTQIFLHRQIFERILKRKLSTDEKIDHIDGNTLNNKRNNLRIADVKQNGQNRKLGSNSTSGYKGVHFVPRLNKWQCRIQANGQRIHLGYFDTPLEAAQEYDIAALKYHGEFARFNL